MRFGVWHGATIMVIFPFERVNNGRIPNKYLFSVQVNNIMKKKHTHRYGSEWLQRKRLNRAQHHNETINTSRRTLSNRNQKRAIAIWTSANKSHSKFIRFNVEFFFISLMHKKSSWFSSDRRSDFYLTKNRIFWCSKKNIAGSTQSGSCLFNLQQIDSYRINFRIVNFRNACRVRIFSVVDTCYLVDQ